MPHPERCPPSREPRPPPQGGGGSNLRRGDPNLFPHLSARPGDPERPGGKGKWKGSCKGWPESCSCSHWGGAPRGLSGQEEAGGRRSREQRRRFPQGCGEEEAELRSVGAGGGVPSPGSGRRRRGPAGAHPTISRPAAGCPLSPRRRLGRPSGRSGTGQGAPRRRIPPDTLQPGLLKGQAGAARGVRGEGQASGLLPPELERVGELVGTESREAAVKEESGRTSLANPSPPAAPRASSSRPPEGSCEGGRGSAHAARSFRRRRRCPNRGRPREKEEK